MVLVCLCVTGSVHPSNQTGPGCGRILVVLFCFKRGRLTYTKVGEGGKREISAWHLTALRLEATGCIGR